MKAIFKMLCIGSLCATAGMANLLTNGSFEDGAFVGNAGGGGMQLTSTSTVLTGWSVNGPHDIIWLANGNGYGLTAEDGTKFLDLTGYEDTTPFDGVSQTVLLAAGDYTLTFDIGTDQDNGSFSGPITVSASAGGPAQDFTFDTTGLSGNVWQKETYNFSVTDAGNVAIDLTGVAGDQYIGLDNADLELANVAAPEPVMTLPFLLVCGALWFARRRQVV